jgi:sirohydrochlorin cobaltochelatase
MINNYIHIKSRLLLLLSLLFILPATVKASDRNFKTQSMLSTMSKNDKLAVVMVYFGTTHQETRTLTIEALNRQTTQLFDSVAKANNVKIDVKQAWTSRIVRKRIAERSGEQISTPTQLLTQLKKEGYTHILVQSANIIEGDEMAEIRRECAAFSNDFKEIRIGDPLLYSVEDVTEVAKIIGNEYAAKIGPSIKCAACGKCKNSQKGSVALFVGHGTYTPATATYSMLEYILHTEHYNNAFVGTIEGHPTISNAKSAIDAYYHKALNLKKMAAKDTTIQKSVTLVPFMFVAGEHAVNDISVEIKKQFEEAGYIVTVVSKGLGELEKIQNLLIKHALFTMNNREITITEKKVAYQK